MSNMEERTEENDESEEERRQRQIELNQPLVALLDSWLNDPEEPTEQDLEDFCEFMRGLDSHRPHRPLFTEYIDQYCKQPNS